MKRLFTLFSVFLFTSMLAVGQTGGTGPEDDFDGDGVKNIDDLDSDNDGILDSYERQIDDSKTITDVFQINGDAVLLDEDNNEIRLTPDLNNKAGQMWSYSKVDFSKDFTISIKVYLGTNDSDGADGIAIVFQNDPDGVNATGQDGEGLGAKGIENGIVLELDTWKNNNKYGDIDDDHGSIERSSDFTNLSGASVSYGDIEDGQWHDVVITWDYDAKTISYTLDGGYEISATINDLLDGIFKAEQVYFGFTASTGGSKNEQKVIIEKMSKTLPFVTDYDKDGIFDHFDYDSDNDGCNDVVEAYGLDADPDNDGIYGTGTPTVDADGKVVGASYDNPLDRDSDGNVDFWQESVEVSAINTQPDNVTISTKGTVTFSVVVDKTGTGSVEQYQWFEQPAGTSQWNALTDDGSTVSGAKTNTLSLAINDMQKNGNKYKVAVTSPINRVCAYAYESNEAILTIEDNTAPVITGGTDNRTTEANENCETALPDYTPGITATDDWTASNDLTITQSPAAGTTITGATNTVTITVTDASNNSTTTTFNVAVIDNTAPVITGGGENKSVDSGDNCEAELPDYTNGITATDNCTASNDLTISQSPAAGTTISGTTNTVTITVTDASNNSTTATFNVAVVDNTAPVITSGNENKSVDSGDNCEAELPDYTNGITATDNCTNSNDLTISQSPASGTTISGTTNTVTITVTDASNNSTTATFNVAVVDNTAPVITGGGEDKSVDSGDNCEAELPDYTNGITATDNCTNSNDLTISQSPAAGTTISGTTNTVTIAVTDASNNSTTVTFNVAVIDNTAPVISCPDDFIASPNIGDKFIVDGTLLDATASDNCEVTSITNDFNTFSSLGRKQFFMLVRSNYQYTNGNIRYRTEN